MRHADPSTPAPRQLSDEERALWEKADAARQAMEAVTQPFTLTTTAHDRGLWSLLGEGEYTAANALCQLAHACNPAVILSLLTALSSEREAGEEAKALHAIRETMAMPGCRASLHFDGAGTVGLEWWVGRAFDDEEDRCLAEADCLPSVAAAVAEAMKQVREDAPSTETPHAEN